LRAPAERETYDKNNNDLLQFWRCSRLWLFQHIKNANFRHMHGKSSFKAVTHMPDDHSLRRRCPFSFFALPARRLHRLCQELPK
jgi:hypothetical protein